MKGLVLPIDKPLGWTSFDVVAKLRGGLRWKKVGHAGTLDPLASGLLLLLCGDCTTRSDEFMSLGKCYTGTIRLGVTTTTDDLGGETIRESAVNWNESKIIEFLHSQVGEIMQRPPAVSAIQVAGKRSYKRVRRGESFLLEPRRVRINELNVLKMESPEVEFAVDCEKGTYVRSIARDLGESLGCGAALSSLRRTRVGQYRIEGAWTIGEALTRPEFRGDAF